jgi:hypothetical protein
MTFHCTLLQSGIEMQLHSAPNEEAAELKDVVRSEGLEKRVYEYSFPD